MPEANTPPTGGTGRTTSQIEAELASIDAASREQQLADTGGQRQTPAADEHDWAYEASRKGWKPEAQYTGPEGKWVDAKTFVERGERFTKKLESEIATLNSKIASFEGTKTQFRKFFDDQMAKRDKEHNEAITALRIQKSQATRDGDDELAVELEDRIDATRKQQAELKAEAAASAAEHQPTTPAPAAAADQPNPVLDEWIADGNDWFKKDDVLTKHAIAVGEQMRKSGEKAIGRKFLEIVAEQVRSDFPRRFKELEAAGNSRQNPADTAGKSGAGAGNQSAGYNGKSERDLPAEDLAIMRQFVKEGLYTKEQFLKSYFSRNGG